ncbi:MAG: TetR/AcrR family transcriptional regulator [Candidatus Nanopelagicales bacterium]|nr:TetR/AcrR family transcriptional regulator [Candidatus Nanopelagicales bacterium]MDZ4248907.1 TetR/AcrR family transcriptional regulator [Candidatus Nanopelagicales bacterium]
MSTARVTRRDPATDRGRRTRSALVAAARGVFEERGFAATRMGDIATAANVSHGTVYTYFDTKEDILAAAVEDLIADLRESIRAVDIVDPVARVAHANERYVAAYAAHARLMRVFEEVATTDAHFREILNDLRRTHANRVAASIRRLQAEGAALVDLPPEPTAAALCAMVEGYARHWFENGASHDTQTAAGTLTMLWARALGLPRVTATTATPHAGETQIPRTAESAKQGGT